MPQICTRFAPSPSGPLHFGSVIAALGSYLFARANRGRWLVRMEDLDPPRELPGAARSILQDLDRLGLISDSPVLFQSDGTLRYNAALQVLARKKVSFPCACSRRDLPESGIYQGTCRNGLGGRTARSVRFICPERAVSFVDLAQGHQTADPLTELGDFVVRRADGLTAYHLAVVVDDAYQLVTHVVRGRDLLSSTTPQILLQNALELPQPQYLHLPIAINHRGNKLSKQTHAKAIGDMPASQVLCDALTFLGLETTDEQKSMDPDRLLLWATESWTVDHVKEKSQYPAPDAYC